MKKGLGIMGLVLVGMLVMGTVTVMAQPYGLSGFVKFSSNETQCSGANVSIMNQRTGEYIYNNTGWGGAGYEGYYLENAGNFPASYIDGDNLTYYTTISGWDNTTYHVINIASGANFMNISLNPTGTTATVAVTDGSITFGNLQLNTVKNTVDVGDTQVINTTGASGNQLIEIKLNESTVAGQVNGSVLTFVSGSPGANQLLCQFKGGDVGAYTALTTTYQEFDNSMAASSNANLDVQLTTPSSVGGDNYYDDYQFEIIVRATLL